MFILILYKSLLFKVVCVCIKAGYDPPTSKLIYQPMDCNSQMDRTLKSYTTGSLMVGLSRAACVVAKRSTLREALGLRLSCCHPKLFILILSLNLCFVSEVQQDNGA